MDSFDLCSLAWGERKGYVVLAVRDPQLGKDDSGYWIDHSFHWPAQKTRIKQVLTNGKQSNKDIYWSPAVYSTKGRHRDKALPTDRLWADLDEIDPNRLPESLKPTAAWESSPGRWQAVWGLDHTLTTEEHEKLNQRLTYAIGADKGGWDTTQVLRTPGTHNHKYPDAPEVKLLWINGRRFKTLTLDKDLPEITGSNGKSPQLPDAQETLDSIDKRLNARGKRLIKARHPNADRSATLWELECILAELGLKAPQIASICQRTVWNKFRDRRDEVQRLITDATKAIAHAGILEVKKVANDNDVLEVDDTPDVEPMSWTEFDRVHTPIRWLVADVWGETEVGFISGLPKSYKSWVALDLAVSVATGTRFLGSFQTHQRNVLLIQEEDPRAVLQDRLMKIGAAKGFVGLGVENNQIYMQYQLPDNLHIISNQGFTLSEEWLELLEAWITTLNIQLLILDPLMMIAGAGFDEFKAFDFMEKVLKPLKRLRARTGSAISIVHHHTKGDQSGGAKGMYGSVALWAWEEAALHLSIETPGKVIAERFSKHSLLAPLGIEIGDVSERWAPSVVAGEATRSSLLDLIASMDEGMTIEELMAYTGLTRPVMYEQLKELTNQKKIFPTRTSDEIPGRVWKIVDTG